MGASWEAIFKIYFWERGYTNHVQCSLRPEEGVGSPGAGDSGDCEPPQVGADNWTQALGKTGNALNHRAITPASGRNFLRSWFPEPAPDWLRRLQGGTTQALVTPKIPRYPSVVSDHGQFVLTALSASLHFPIVDQATLVPFISGLLYFVLWRIILQHSTKSSCILGLIFLL